MKLSCLDNVDYTDDITISSDKLADSTLQLCFLTTCDENIFKIKFVCGYEELKLNEYKISHN